MLHELSFIAQEESCYSNPDIITRVDHKRGKFGKDHANSRTENEDKDELTYFHASH